MSERPPFRILLGPQRPSSNLAQLIGETGIPEGTLAVISAGWQEAEGDLAEIAELIDRPLVDLRLYQRAEGVFEANPALWKAYRERQDGLVQLQGLYRTRLKHLSAAARQLLRADEDPDIIAAEQRHAIAQLRALDRHQLQRTEVIQERFQGALGNDLRAELAAHRQEIEEILRGSAAVLITGGNVLVLLNRIRLFGIEALLANHHLIAWSAGAMVLTDRVILYHDRTPQGRRDPEVLGAGVGLVPGCVVLPNTRRRLRASDRTRLALY
ncbi:MAG: Type 1 glutamine amidotransferase-like domain-containing protein, partial [Xanthomonadales bacterium]|nr:Type 1 glutamine amidotransferase-like domain-containing protein [Xanthomonadales bacterium]